MWGNQKLNQEEPNLRRFGGSSYQEEVERRGNPREDDKEECEKRKRLVSWSFMTSNPQPHINRLKLSLLQLQPLEVQVVNLFPLHFCVRLLFLLISHSGLSSKSSQPPAPLNHFPRCWEQQSFKVEGKEAQQYTAEHVHLLRGKWKELLTIQHDWFPNPVMVISWIGSIWVVYIFESYFHWISETGFWFPLVPLCCTLQ